MGVMITVFKYQEVTSTNTNKQTETKEHMCWVLAVAYSGSQRVKLEDSPNHTDYYKLPSN